MGPKKLPQNSRQISHKTRRRRDNNKNKIFAFEGGGGGLGAERKIFQNAVFRGKRHDNKILNVQILLSRNFVVIAQAPKDPCKKQKKSH